MPSRPEHYEDLAMALEYPTPSTRKAANEAAERLGSGESAHARMAAAIAELASFLEQGGLEEAEERYTSLFDMKPVCTLNVGWHLFGDTYDRGALLAALVPELDTRAIDHHHDLPDYLPTLLRLLGRTDDAEERALLAHAVIMPALQKMASCLEQSTDPWSCVVRALPELLAAECPRGRVEIPTVRRSLEVLPC